MIKKNFLFIVKHLFFNFSLLRIFQILELLKLPFIKGKVADLGAEPEKPRNITQYIKKQKIDIVYFNKNFQIKKNKNKNKIKINFDKMQISSFSNYFNLFNCVMIFNVLEHVYDYNKLVKFSYKLLKKDGYLVGSTPFLFRKHPSPEDYCRFTDTKIYMMLKQNKFKNIKTIPIPRFKSRFRCIYFLFINSASVYLNSFRILNGLFFIFFYLLEKIIAIIFFTKTKLDTENKFALGYFFYASK